MKAYLFFLLIGLAFSFSCVKEYITTKEPGRASGLIFHSCACPTGFKGIISDLDSSSCTCFLKEELSACQSDSRCEVAASIGCRNK